MLAVEPSSPRFQIWRGDYINPSGILCQYRPSSHPNHCPQDVRTLDLTQISSGDSPLVARRSIGQALVSGTPAKGQTCTQPHQESQLFSKSATTRHLSFLSCRQPMVFHCSTCGFDVDCTERYHKRKVHQKETVVRYPDTGEEETVVQRIPGVFYCVRCVLSFPDPVRLQEHTVECYAPNPALLPLNAPVAAAPISFFRQPAPAPLSSPVSSPLPGLGISRPSFPHYRPPSAPPPPPKQKIEDFPSLIPEDYLYIPEDTTFTQHRDVPLRSYELVINVDYGNILICLTCGKLFDLVTPHELKFPVGRIKPIFGLKLHPDALYFCSRCGHGFRSESSLRTHQSDARCARIGGEIDEHYIAYGQSFGFTTSKFSVDVSLLARRADSSIDPSLIYSQTFAPEPDYSRLPTALPVNTQDLDQFHHREGWIDHLQGLTPVEIQLFTALPDERDHPYLPRLREYVLKLLQVVQGYMKKHCSHGLMRKMARVGVAEAADEFRVLLPNSLAEYSREVVRLLFNSIEQARGAIDTTYYPLSEEQKKTLIQLHKLLLLPSTRPEDAAPILHHALFLLFAVEKEHGGVSNFQMAGICYLVARSMGPSEWIRTSEIGRLVAKLMWATRGVILYAMERDMITEKLSTSAAYDRYKRFLIDGEDTLMAYLYNIAALIKSIRGEEYNEASCQISDEFGRELIFNGEMIKLDDISVLHDGLRAEYDKIILEEIFFGEPLPSWFNDPIDIPSLVDDPRNNTAGYSFLDHPKNNFVPMFGIYGGWLLSCPIRAARFVDIIDGRVAWKAGPCYQLLLSFSKLRHLLCTRNIVDVGPSVRATEIARDLLRNLSGAAVRSLMLLFHLVCIVAVQDKTSHKILKKRFTPGAPTTETAIALIRSLVFFRRFESDLIRYFKGDLHAERYNMYLWPDIAANMSGDTISEDLGDATEKYLGVRLQILEWRGVTTAFMHYHGDPAADLPADSYYDLLANHSSGTARQRYGVDRASLANTPTHHIKGCPNATIKWQSLARISGTVPLRLSMSNAQRILLPDVAADLGSSAPTPSEIISKSDVVAIVGETLRIYETSLKDTLASTFAELATVYFPKPPPPPLPHSLRPISALQVHPSRLHALRDLLKKPHAIFHGPQGELVEKMQARGRHVLAILACDSGKTTMIMFQAKKFDAHLVTLVILPLSGLHRDFHKRATEHDLKIAVFDPHAFLLARIGWILTNFKFARTLQLQKLLARIVIDEIHILLTSAAHREPMVRLIKILGIETQITGMSGSIPPQLFPAFCELTGTDSWDVIRMSTVRPNIRYGVVLDDSDKYIARAVKYVKDRVANDYGPNDKAMVFCRTRAIVDAVAELLGTTGYHAATPIATQDRLFRDFVSGKQQVMVASSILGIGVDQPVRDTVHIDVGHNLIDQTQEDNCAGRNGKNARCIYFLPHGRKPIRAEVGHLFGAELLVPWALNVTECRRLIISLFLDGVGVTCIELGTQKLCDNCRRQLKNSTPPPIALLTPISNSTLVDGGRHPRNKNLRRALLQLLAAAVQRPTIPRGIKLLLSVRPFLERRTSPVRLKRQPRQIGPAEDEEEEREVFGIAPRSLIRSATSQSPLQRRPAAHSWDDPMASPISTPSHRARPQISPSQGSRPDPATLSLTSFTFRHNSDQSPERQRSLTQSGAEPINNPLPRNPPSIQGSNTGPAPRVGLSISIAHAGYLAGERTELQFFSSLADAIEKLRLACSPCWARGIPDWAQHERENCPNPIGNSRDDWFVGWVEGALRSKPGFCCGCCRPQGKPVHPYVKELADCPHKHIIKAALFAFITAPADPIHYTDLNTVPTQLEDFEQIWQWGMEVERHSERKITNLLRLFHDLALARKLIK
ncbi:hypothetical protein DFH09DRAFT_1103329 [Mycena vulgaris]|nr:hypothetical protein DFH09DRAFT_1103329 [Mycena vulgaris]